MARLLSLPRLSGLTGLQGLLVLQEFFLQQGIGCRGGCDLLGHATFAAQFAEQVLEGMLEFGRGAFDGLLQAIGLVADGNRLMAFGACLHLAAHVVGAWLVAVLIAQVDFDAGEVFFVAFERAFYRSAYPLFETGTALDMVVAVDLDLHSSIPYSASSQENDAGHCGLWKSSPLDYKVRQLAELFKCLKKKNILWQLNT